MTQSNLAEGFMPKEAIVENGVVIQPVEIKGAVIKSDDLLGAFMPTKEVVVVGTEEQRIDYISQLHAQREFTGWLGKRRINPINPFN